MRRSRAGRLEGRRGSKRGNRVRRGLLGELARPVDQAFELSRLVFGEDGLFGRAVRSVGHGQQAAITGLSRSTNGSTE